MCVCTFRSSNPHKHTHTHFKSDASRLLPLSTPDGRWGRGKWGRGRGKWRESLQEVNEWASRPIWAKIAKPLRHWWNVTEKCVRTHTHAHARFYLSHTQWLQVSTSRSKNLVQNSVTNFDVCLQNLHSCMQSNTHISFHKITSQFRATLEICRTVHTLHSSVYLADIFLVCVKWSFS